MLMYGVAKPELLNIQFAGKGVIYNLSSLKEGFQSLQSLIPPNNIGRLVDRDFDIAYMNYVFGNDIVFLNFFTIIYNLYIGNDVLLLTSDEDWAENLLESLLKLIQQRYGYNAVLINSDDDYIYARNSMIVQDFAPGYGLYNLDMDKQRFVGLYTTMKLEGYNLPFIEGFELDDQCGT